MSAAKHPHQKNLSSFILMCVYISSSVSVSSSAVATAAGCASMLLESFRTVLLIVFYVFLSLIVLLF